MTEVLKERLRSLKINGLLDKTILKISKIGLRELCGIAAVSYGILLFSAVAVLNLDIGYKVVVNNKDYGTVASKKEAETALNEAILEASASEEAFELHEAGVYFNIAEKSKMASGELVKNEIVSDLDGLVFGYGIYVDGNEVAALTSEEEAESLVNELLNSYKTETNEVSFVNKIEVAGTRVRDSLLMDRASAAGILTGSREEAVVHTVCEGETFSQIAENYNISSETLMSNNSGIVPEKLQIGQKLTVTAPVPLVSVKTVEQITVTEKVPYEVTEQQDSSMYKGIRKVIKSGVQGEKNVVYNVTKVNNNIKEKTKVDEAYISYPVTEVVAVGTKIKPKETPTGKFIRPYYGSITSRYGSRWGRNHNGIDYGGSVGDPVKAADGGTVKFAGWNSGGYGNLVIINHGNGKETYYAHLSAVGVKAGQKVAQGAVIGKLGNTGRSTGPHLHFEIRINGRPVNPSGYVG